MATSALAHADDAVISAYQAVLQAEGAGANISSLLIQLNDAGGLLAHARMAYDLGDFEEAVSLANASGNLGIEAEKTAVELKNSAFLERMQHMWFNMISSIVGVVLVFLGSFWAWRVFRRRYDRQVLAKAEVKSSES